jgi:hypothetical protein
MGSDTCMGAGAASKTMTSSSPASSRAAAAKAARLSGDAFASEVVARCRLGAGDPATMLSRRS